MHLRPSSRATRSQVLWSVAPVEFGKSGGPGRVVARVAARESSTTTAWRMRRYGSLTIYAKGDRSTIPAHELKTIKEAIYRGQEEKNEP